MSRANHRRPMKRLSPRQREALALVANGRFFPDFVKEEDGWHARWRAAVPGAPDEWVDEFVRAPSVSALSEDAEDQHHETLHDAWALALRSRTGLVRWNEDDCAAFARELKDWQGDPDADQAHRQRLLFRLTGTAEGFMLRCLRPRGRAALKALGQAVYVWGPLRGLVAAGDELVVRLELREAEDFINRGAKELREAGYAVEGVDFRAKVTAEAEVTAPAAELPAAVRLSVKVDGQCVTAEEIRFLLEQGSSLVFFRDHWIEVDRAILKEALKALEKQGKVAANPLAFALGIGAVGRLEFGEAKVTGVLGTLLARFREMAAAAKASVGASDEALPGFAGTLRPYQRLGSAWIDLLTTNGFGALLADDMGLGKTIQTIAWILKERAASTTRFPFLVVAPLTLLGNWKHEFAKFAPTLRVLVHQGDLRHVGSGFRRAVREADVVITGYSLLVRDHRALAEVEWEGIVLDEAQAIKNPDTQAARAVRALGVRRRLALTGTPIENSVMDIWSLEEFLNPGLLGERKAFVDRFAKPLAEDRHAAAGKRLQRALEPFVLRRLKTDAALAGELPEKREVTEYCALTAAERFAYEEALADYRQSARHQGDIFALLTRLKLICDGEGKIARLIDLLEAVFERGESALVFTQYAKVGQVLKERLAARFARPIPFLHGALSPRAREMAVRAFETAPAPTAFVLSLKAGGFGLNLTKASHVIHFDRWWNPAVENQATDRAHRIGQRRDVLVHAFVTEGTLEERVEEVLAKKASLAGLLKDGQELWDIIAIR